jgi:peptide/nickel transport system ATP-binding protein
MVEQKQIRLEGSVPSAIAPPPGCRFHTRCPRRSLLPDGGAICAQEVPPWRHASEEHRIFCHIPIETLTTFEPVVTTGD